MVLYEFLLFLELVGGLGKEFCVGGEFIILIILIVLVLLLVVVVLYGLMDW